MDFPLLWVSRSREGIRIKREGRKIRKKGVRMEGNIGKAGQKEQCL